MSSRTAIVTGASSGIGAATARSLADLDMHVVLVARRESKLRELENDIAGRGGKASILVGDVSSAEGARAVVEEVASSFDSLDVLVNNAGIMSLGRVRDSDPKDWDAMIQLDLLGVMYCSQAALRVMAEAQTGHIVNVASNLGRTFLPGSAAYSAAKSGVIAFSEALRREALEAGVRVTTVEPGAVKTELHDHIADGELQKQTKAFLDRVDALHPEDVAAAIAYAVSQPARVNVCEILVRPTKQEL